MKYVVDKMLENAVIIFFFSKWCHAEQKTSLIYNMKFYFRNDTYKGIKKKNMYLVNISKHRFKAKKLLYVDR